MTFQDTSYAFSAQLHYIYKSSIPTCCATECCQFIKSFNVLNQLYESQCLRVRVYFSESYFSSHLLRVLVCILVIARTTFHPVFQSQSRFCGCKDMFPIVCRKIQLGALKVSAFFYATNILSFLRWKKTCIVVVLQ